MLRGKRRLVKKVNKRILKQYRGIVECKWNSGYRRYIFKQDLWYLVKVIDKLSNPFVRYAPYAYSYLIGLK